MGIIRTHCQLCDTRLFQHKRGCKAIFCPECAEKRAKEMARQRSRADYLINREYQLAYKKMWRQQNYKKAVPFKVKCKLCNKGFKTIYKIKMFCSDICQRKSKRL